MEGAVTRYTIETPEHLTELLKLMVKHSIQFEVTPYPYDEFAVVVKSEHDKLMASLISDTKPTPKPYDCVMAVCFTAEACTPGHMDAKREQLREAVQRLFDTDFHEWKVLEVRTEAHEVEV